MSEQNSGVNMTDTQTNDAIRWLIVLIAAFLLLWLLLFARGAPGVDGRQPDPPGAAAAVLSPSSELT